MTSLAMAVSDGLTITRRNLIKVKRVPDLIVFATLSPIMFVLLFRFVFGGAINVPGDVSYAEFLLPGIFAQTVVFGSTVTLVRDMRTKNASLMGIDSIEITKHRPRARNIAANVAMNGWIRK